MLIRVEQKHIDKGVRYESCECPVALAIKDAGFVCPDVCQDEVSFITGPGARFQGKPPRSVQRFISKFDTKRPVVPFVFKLNVPDPKLEASHVG